MLGTKSNCAKIIQVIILIFFAFYFGLCPIYLSAESKKIKTIEAKKTQNTNVQANQTDKEEKNTDDTEKINPTDQQNNLYDYEKPVAEDESYSWMIIKTIIVLGLMVSVFYYFFKFVTKKTGIHPIGREVIKILSMIPVGQNKYLHVVDLAGKIMVIGVSDSNINLITEIKDKDEIDRIRLLSSKSTPVEQVGFQEYITTQLSKVINFIQTKQHKGKPPQFHVENEQSEFETKDKIDYLQRQKERLKRLNGFDDKE